MKSIKIQKPSPQVTRIRKTGHNKAGDKIILYALSDVHFDSPKCDRNLFFKHMDMAREEGALVHINGDFLDIMACKNDRRRSKSLLRPEYSNANYIDCVVNDAIEKLSPYARNIVSFVEGNHESAILRHQETDVVDRITQGLKWVGSPVQRGGYRGYLIITFERGGNSNVNMIGAWSHGKWGGVISKGTQGVMRDSAWLPDATFHIKGHIHTSWVVPQPQYRINQNYEVEVAEQMHFQCGTYKRDDLHFSGFHAEKIQSPGSTNMWRLEFTLRTRKSGMRYVDLDWSLLK